MNSPDNNNTDPSDAIMNILSKIDLTITITDVRLHPEYYEGTQDDGVITKKLRERLSRATSTEIRAIITFMNRLETSGSDQNKRISILRELKTELAENFDRSIADIVKRSYINMLPPNALIGSNVESVSRTVGDTLDPNEHPFPNTLQ